MASRAEDETELGRARQTKTHDPRPPVVSSEKVGLGVRVRV